MMKKILAAAIVSAFAAPAFAATANVDISGFMSWDVSKVDKTGTATQDTTRVNNNNSRITLKGSEDLGGGMKAGFSATYGWGLGNSSALSSQETFAFIGGGWGEARVGVHDPLIKAVGRATDLFGNQSTGDTRHMTPTSSTTNVDGRANNVVAYISPSFNGFQVALGRAMDETTTANSQEADMALVTYKNGPLYLGLGYDKRDLTSDQKAMRLGAGYTMGDLRFVGSYTSYDNVGGTATADIDVWGLGAGYKMGAITIKGQYYDLDDDRANRDSKMYAIGADYAFSKRTVAQLAYSKVTNGSSASYGGGAPVAGMDSLTISGGFDPTRLSLGLVHSF